MPPIQSKPSGHSTSLVYITLGALVTVWSGVWYLYNSNTETPSRGVHYVCAGLLLTGIALLAIGFYVGGMARRAHDVALAQETAKIDAIEKNPSVAQKV